MTRSRLTDPYVINEMTVQDHAKLLELLAQFFCTHGANFPANKVTAAELAAELIDLVPGYLGTDRTKIAVLCERAFGFDPFA